MASGKERRAAACFSKVSLEKAIDPISLTPCFSKVATALAVHSLPSVNGGEGRGEEVGRRGQHGLTRVNGGLQRSSNFTPCTACAIIIDVRVPRLRETRHRFRLKIDFSAVDNIITP
jgi:hypothetical protein